MLAKFSVKNFKNFKESFTLDLTQTKQYGFSKDCVKNDIVKTGLIYGPNSIGKSNLGRAIFDIVLGLTDKQKRYDLYLVTRMRWLQVLMLNLNMSSILIKM